MVDDFLLQDMMSIFAKIKMFRESSVFSDFMGYYGLNKEGITEEEIELAIVEKNLSDEEIDLYKKYMEFRKKYDLVSFGRILDDLGTLTGSTSALYDLRGTNTKTIKALNEIINKIDVALSNLPNIRIGTEYHKVKNSYDKYFKTYIRNGMKRATFTEPIDDINRSSAFIKRIKRNKLAKLQKCLALHNATSEEVEKRLYQEHLDEKINYREYLISVMIHFLDRYPELYEAGLMTLKSLNGVDIPVKKMKNGTYVVDRKKGELPDSTTIAKAVFNYIVDLDIPEFDEKEFIKAFRDFLVHSYVTLINQLNEENDKTLKQVRNNFEQQKSMIDSLYTLKGIVPVLDKQEEGKEEDTFALIYDRTRFNKKS